MTGTLPTELVGFQLPRLFPLAQTLTVEQQEEVEEELEVVEEEEEEEAAENSPDASSLHQMLYRVPWMF